MKIMPFLKRQNSVFLTTLIGLILIGILICLPTGYEDALIYQGTERAVGKVVETDNYIRAHSVRGTELYAGNRKREF